MSLGSLAYWAHAQDVGLMPPLFHNLGTCLMFFSWFCCSASLLGFVVKQTCFLGKSLTYRSLPYFFYGYLQSPRGINYLTPVLSLHSVPIRWITGERREIASRFHNRSVSFGSKPHTAALESLLDIQSQSQTRPPDIDAALRPGPGAVGAEVKCERRSGPSPTCQDLQRCSGWELPQSSLQNVSLPRPGGFLCLVWGIETLGCIYLSLLSGLSFPSQPLARKKISMIILDS